MSFKKTLCSLIAGAMLTLNTTPLFSQNYNFKPVKQEAKQESVIPWLWLGANVLAAGASTYFTIDALNSKNEYEKQLSILDNTTMDNYNKLLKMKSDAEGKLNLALGLGIGTGISVLANIIFWNSFNEDKKLSTGYDPSKQAYILKMNKEF